MKRIKFLFVLSVLVLITNALVFAAGVTYTTQESGAWGTIVWDASTPPTTLNNTNDIVNIGYINTIPDPDDTLRHNITLASDLSFNKAATLNIYGSLSITGRLFAKADLTINIYDGGSLSITDSLIAESSITLNVSGSLLVEGSTTSKNGSDITINNTGNADLGDISYKNGGALDVHGVIVAEDISFENGGAIEVFAGGYLEATTVDMTGTGTFVNNGTIDVPSISGVTVSGSGVNLPIELASFKAAYAANTVNIYWQTASEKTNDYFTIERSKDGVNYYTIAEIKGAGNSYTTLNYSYTDYNPLQGVSYYRLTQTDYDGESKIFDPISVAYINEGELKIGPNPAQNILNVSVGGELGSGTIKLYNITGAVVKQINMNSNHSILNISDLPSGTYMMVIGEGNTNISKRIIKE